MNSTVDTRKEHGDFHAAYLIADVVKTFLAFACIVIGGVFLLFSGIVLLILGSPTGFTEKERRE